MALAGCQRSTASGAINRQSSPTSPTSLLAVQGSSPSSEPLLAIADVQGEWDVTIAADASCQQIPASLRTRTYLVNIGWYTDGRSYEARLEGSRFFFQNERFRLIPRAGGALLQLSSLYALETWHDQSSIFERLDSGGYLELMGTADVPIDRSTSIVSASIVGSVGYCPTVSSDAIYPHPCPNISRCALDRLTLTRR